MTSNFVISGSGGDNNLRHMDNCPCCGQYIVTQDDVNGWFCFYCDDSNPTSWRCGQCKGSKTHADERSAGIIIFQKDSDTASSISSSNSSPDVGYNSLRGFKTLLLLSKGGKWGFPKGHLNQGETMIQAALRETLEESGLVVDEKEIDLSCPPMVARYRCFRKQKNSRQVDWGFAPWGKQPAAHCTHNTHTAAQQNNRTWKENT